MVETTPLTESTPLRERAQQVLRYPAQSGPLSTILALAVSAVVASWIPVLGGILDLIVWAALFKYGFEVLRWSANGRHEAPEISFTVSDTVAIYAVLLLILVNVLLLALGRFYGLIPALVVGLLLMAAMPAMVMILALEEGIGRALNPLAWLQLGQRLGKQYLLLIAFFCATLIVQSVVGVRSSVRWPGAPRRTAYQQGSCCQ